MAVLIGRLYLLYRHAHEDPNIVDIHAIKLPKYRCRYQLILIYNYVIL